MITKLTAAILLLALAAPAGLADTLMVIKEGSFMVDGDAGVAENAQEGAGGEVSTVDYWSRADRMARIDDTGKLVAHLDSGVTYVLNKPDKTCFAIPADRGADDAVPAQADFRRTGETRQVGAWQAERYDMQVVSGNDEFRGTIWVSDEVAVDTGRQRAYLENVATPDTAWVLEMFDLGGYPVRHEFRMGPVLTWSELISVEDKPAPAGTYELPSGYSGCE